ncbi:VRR-NUC domain-containing protein [Choanephora cucurbitarum]|nr:VRR-NUC domain-containing protein [Choanephora cucurbitarum]
MSQQRKRKSRSAHADELKKIKPSQSSIMSYFNTSTQTKTMQETDLQTVKQDLSIQQTIEPLEQKPELIEEKPELVQKKIELEEEKTKLIEEKPEPMENELKIETQSIVIDGSLETQKDTEEAVFTTSMYTDEVNHMIDTVLMNEEYLFSKDELTRIDTYKALDDEPKHLIVRLLMRKHGWIRKNRVNYESHVSDLDAAIDSLESCGFLHTKITDLAEASAILSKLELAEIVKERHIPIAVENPKKADYAREMVRFGHCTAPTIATHYQNTSIDESKLQKLWNSIYNCLGPCIKVDTELHDLFQRLQLVYYRINSLLDTNKMATSILARTSKRNYPKYEASRSNCIWSSRDDLLQYEQALVIEREYHLSMEDLYFINRSKRDDDDSGLVRQQMIQNWTLCENCIGLWESCLVQSEISQKPYHLRRFEAGWIYTRLLDHGTELLAKLHEYELEALILQKLLGQHMYRLGKRGKWYDRLALVQANYLNKDQGRAQKKAALQTCIDAIHDPRVHQIFLHDIHKRIKQLERDLCIPKREQHDFSYMRLKKPKEITIYGERISNEVTGKKSIWRSDNGSECSVEQLAIEYYEKKGYKGMHCENGIIRMIAVLLFWDVIFASIPGVFETPYQSEPLDLRTDAFYESRLDMIQDRLSEIEQGKHLELITEVDSRERPRRTMCVGVNWNYETKDILEIAQCIGPSSLAALCKLFFEEFGQRQGGMPDLCCWNYDKRHCLFSEVKGPKDILSKTQKVWIETLTGVGIQVEVCHVQVWRGEDVFLKEDVV